MFIVVVESNPLEIKVIGGLMRYTKGDPIIMLKLMDRDIIMQLKICHCFFVKKVLPLLFSQMHRSTVNNQSFNQKDMLKLLQHLL